MNTPYTNTVLDLHVARISGAGGRSSNQDSLASANQDDLACFVIADGAGGHEGGEIASAIVTRSVIDEFLKDSSFGTRAIRSYVDHAISIVRQRQGQEQRLKEMSATVAVLLIDPQSRVATWAHLGDTRIYLFRRNRIDRITKDHSLVQQFIDAGYCKQSQLRAHPQRSKLFAAIGADFDLESGLPQDETAIEDGDIFLICTDGFWEWITEAEMERTLSMSDSAESWLADMTHIVEVNGAAARNSQDNFTAFAIWVGEPNQVTVRK